MVSKILDWLGYRISVAWHASFIHNLWNAEKLGFVNSIYTSVNAAAIGMSENVEVLSPPISLSSSPTGPYDVQLSYDFAEDQQLQLGQFVWIDSNGTTTYTEPSGSGYTKYVVPSAITDTENNQHVVFPVWSYNQTLTSPKWEFVPFTFAYKHNISYIGGDLDYFSWNAITFTDATISNENITVATEINADISTYAKIIDSSDNIFYGFVKTTSSSEITIEIVGNIPESVATIYLYTQNL